MGINTKIEWATHSLNFWIGCTKVAAGCLHCYADREMKRWGKNFNIIQRTSRQTWNQVKKYKPGDRIFICSWSDFFHKDADQWRNEAWAVIRSRPDVTWIILTKRIKRIHFCSFSPKNLWLGVSVSTQKDVDEYIPELLQMCAETKIVSFEPLLEDIKNINTEHIEQLGWAIIGCESGPERRECKNEWVTELVKDFHFFNKPVFVKQINVNGKVIKMPKDFPQEYPKRR